MVADSPLGTGLCSASDVASGCALGSFTLERDSSPCPAEPCCHSCSSQDTHPTASLPTAGALECHHFPGKTNLRLAGLPSQGCHPALAGTLSPPVIVPTPSSAGVYSAVAETEVPGRVAWFQHQLLKVMACKDSLYGRGLPKPQGDLHFCLSIRPLGLLPAQQNLAWSTTGGWGRNPESDQGVNPLHQHSTQPCEPEPSGFVQVSKNLLPQGVRTASCSGLSVPFP